MLDTSSTSRQAMLAQHRWWTVQRSAEDLKSSGLWQRAALLRFQQTNILSQVERDLLTKAYAEV